eukprot:3820249-Pyramimonas_sp.AAC.1
MAVVGCRPSAICTFDGVDHVAALGAHVLASQPLRPLLQHLMQLGAPRDLQHLLEQSRDVLAAFLEATALAT